ncbi:MAG: hypothetical protein CMD89_05255 [Gammaproteobacteria bacterium]|nr:hypothetical protein [Gammaproteobacteria bacterium]|tara:strand:- start:1755 stop:2837 length:1083 start_codon:yes stop_codon:yes gene_type:complete
MKPAEFASQFRYSEDRHTKKNNFINNKLEVYEVHNSLMITKNSSPIIYSSLKRVAKNLLIDHIQINLYVYGSSEINAKCYNGYNGGYVVILSSALVTLLEGNELDFVIGHELGHLLFGHTKEISFSSPEGMKLSRAKELSVDRIGLVATRDLDATLRAIVKTISGLPSKFLNFNIAEFINQLRKFDVDASDLLGQTTHPSFPIRARALLLFSQSDEYQLLFGEKGKKLLEIDKAIKREMDKHIDKSFNERTLELKKAFNFWLTCFAAISDKSLSKDEQTFISKKYGKEKLNKFKALIVDRSLKEIEDLVNNRLLKAWEELTDFKTISASEGLTKEITELTNTFKIQDLEQRFRELLKEDK